ncbi:hypothetical protein LguiA_006975 [Lonicera macranthoides]
MDKVHSEKKVKRITSKKCKDTGTAMDSSGNGNLETKFQDKLNKKRRCNPLQLSASPTICSWEGPCMMPLLSIPSAEECNNSYGPPIVLTGTARKAGTGPSVGAVDIGVSKSAYFFQVALPGVKKDPASAASLSLMSSSSCLSSHSVKSSSGMLNLVSERFIFLKFDFQLTGKLHNVIRSHKGEFSCEIERDGKVHIKGVTSTGGKLVKRQSRVFEMKFQQQSPPGPFMLSFSLPGPVDPRLFFPKFRSDGILEAVIAKY